MTQLECPHCHHAWAVEWVEEWTRCPACGAVAHGLVFIGVASLHAHGLRSPWEVTEAGR